MKLPTLQDLKPFQNKRDLLEKVVLQIQKDFEWFDLQIVFKSTNHTPYKELFQQIYPKVDFLLNENPNKFYNLLYRIDIEDTLLKKHLKAHPHSDTAEVITDLILKRELQKVVIREMLK
ncbi:MAG: hypothetical protein Kow0079_17350 [Vicingaceae bacterium]